MTAAERERLRDLLARLSGIRQRTRLLVAQVDEVQELVDAVINQIAALAGTSARELEEDPMWCDRVLQEVLMLERARVRS